MNPTNLSCISEQGKCSLHPSKNTDPLRTGAEGARQKWSPLFYCLPALTDKSPRSSLKECVKIEGKEYLTASSLIIRETTASSTLALWRTCSTLMSGPLTLDETRSKGITAAMCCEDFDRRRGEREKHAGVYTSDQIPRRFEPAVFSVVTRLPGFILNLFGHLTGTVF